MPSASATDFCSSPAAARNSKGRSTKRARSFWLTLLILPIAIAIGPLSARFLDDDSPDRVMVIDRSGGGEAKAIADRITLDHNRDVLTQLSRYVQRHHMEAADPTALWAQHDR